MTRPVRPSEQHRSLVTAISRLDRFAAAHAQVVANLRDWSAGIGSGGGPKAKGAVSDPTGEGALNVDEWGQMRERVAELVDRVWRDAMELEGIRAKVAAPPPPKAPEHRGLTRCANLHGCPDDAWATKAGRCEACYRYLRRTDRDRRLSGVRDEC